MSAGHLFCCPLCSVMPPPGAVLTPEERRGYFCQPTLWRGRRSGKFWIVRRLGCAHGPASEAAQDTDADLVAAWNAWAESAADVKAARLGFDADRMKRWRYELGIAGLPEIQK